MSSSYGGGAVHQPIDRGSVSSTNVEVAIQNSATHLTKCVPTADATGILTNLSCSDLAALYGARSFGMMVARPARSVTALTTGSYALAFEAANGGLGDGARPGKPGSAHVESGTGERGRTASFRASPPLPGGALRGIVAFESNANGLWTAVSLRQRVHVYELEHRHGAAGTSPSYHSCAERRVHDCVPRREIGDA